MPLPNDRPTMHDLIKHLGDTLVENEVIAPMAKIGWDHGTPPPPTAPGQPQPTGEAPPSDATTPPGQPQTVAPAAVQTDALLDINAHFESLRGANGLILDKYPNVTEAIKGVGNAVIMA